VVVRVEPLDHFLLIESAYWIRTRIL
jgi:hypothetical protein